MAKKAYLLLQNCQIFEGRAFGADCDAMGEAVFITSMTGYIETLTDASYHGQIIVQTFPLIGNYGVIRDDFEGPRAAPNAYVVREWCDAPSNFRCEQTIDAFLKEQGIPGVYGVDTRAITRTIRDHGVMNGLVLHSDPREDMKSHIARLSAYAIENAVENCTCSHIQTFPAENERYKVVLLDCGSKRNIVRELLRRGCSVIVVPAHTAAKEILDLQPSGIVLSNGPGDPAKNTGIIEELQALLKSSLPMLGICLGHQLLALSQGAQTHKLKYGHRGANQPVLDKNRNRVFITTQNHGYAVKNDTVNPDIADIRFINGNDGTCEGIQYKHYPAFSVQFHPESAAGPQDMSFLFDDFIAMMA